MDVFGTLVAANTALAPSQKEAKAKSLWRHNQAEDEMTSLSQSPRDRTLWILSEHGGQMERAD
jgi:hypothetical protein